MTIAQEQHELARICAGMTQRGIPLDMPRLAEVRAMMKSDKLAISDKNSLTPDDVERYAHFLPAKDLKALRKGSSLNLNLNSSKQVRGFLELNGVNIPNTKFDTIAKYAERFPQITLLQDIMDFKSFGKGDKAWFGDEYIRDERLHPRWNPTGTSERRLSCSKPNFQNVPHRAKGGDSYFAKLIRSVVIPEQGCVLAELDASQGEDWTVAFDVFKRIGDETMLTFLRTKADLHSRTGAYITRTPVHKCSSSENPEMYLARDRGKRINHSHKYMEGFKYATNGSREHYRCDRDVANGLAVVAWRGDGYTAYFGAWRLSELAYGDTSQANQRRAIGIKSQLMQDYPGILEWQRVVFETWRGTGMVRNSFGFSRPLYGEPAECAKRAAAFVGASNLQTIVIRGMIECVRELNPRLHAQIHDSLLHSDPGGATVQMTRIMQRDRDGLVVPWESSEGARWSEI